MNYSSSNFQEAVSRAAAFHGHLCSGLYIGVRMEVLAEQLLRARGENEWFYIEVETDRCPADGILSAAGISIGRRRLKMLDYGKCAARFYDVRSGAGYRLLFDSQARPKKGDDIVGYFSDFADDDLFRITRIRKEFRPCDLPGPMTSIVVCAGCGEEVQDCREITWDGLPLCKPCRDERLHALACAGKK